MSYGQPCKRTTGWPFLGPASMYPTSSTPALICFNSSNMSRSYAVERYGELAQRHEGCSHLRREELGLFPSREMAAFGEPVVVHEIGIGLLGPAARRGVDLVRKDAHGSG